MRSGLSKQELSQRQENSTILAAIFVVAVFALYLALPIEGTSERLNIIWGENLRLLRAQTDYLFLTLQSHPNSRGFSALLVPLPSSRFYGSQTLHDDGGKVTEIWRAAVLCGVGESKTLLCLIRPSDFYKVIMGRGPPTCAGEVNNHPFPPSYFAFAQAFNSIITFYLSTICRPEIRDAVAVEVFLREAKPSGILNGHTRGIVNERGNGNGS